MSQLSKTAKDIFLAALEAAPAERSALLDDACAADAALRQQVEMLLQAHDEPDSMLDRSRIDLGLPMDASAFKKTVIEPRISEGPGTVIGPYKLLEQIGEGGFGVVYMADQQAPVRRRVALKIIKPGMDTRQVLVRFKAELQALSLMDHPNIARALDAGATDSGRPYFVMELVRGVPITEYCDQNNLAVHERLELFVTVCHAVQHAHQKGIIHRDIKPSNVLVTMYDGRPVPKVIDFGVAKAINQQLTQETIFTRFAEMIGTPLYMSPEQAEMTSLDIDTRSDIYSLGVLLYELLTGSTPFDRERLKQAAFDEIRRIIREEEPAKPSTRISTLGATSAAVAAHRHADPRRLGQLMRGDLDWIVMKALEKDRTRRYETANGLAMDLQRHLEHEPVVARPPSTIYRLQKAWRRNRLASTAAAAVAAALIIAISFAFLAYTARMSRLEEALAATEAHEERDSVLETQRREQRVRVIDIPQIRQLLELEHFVPAFQLAQQAKAILPNDPALAELWKQLVTATTITTEPSGAQVWIRDWRATDGDEQWLELGQTPLHDVEVPQNPREEGGVFRWRFKKDGHLARELNASAGQIARMAPIDMPEGASVPEGMVYMPADGADKDLGDFWIDRFEVTNRQFQGFVDAGGYERREYWEHEFLQEGKTISWEEAVKVLRDETGKPGPAMWADGRYPGGEGDYPVRGVSWYEAAAYAKFAGKSLPTIHHWAWAANLDGARFIVPLSNFSDRGPARVGSQRGIGRFDVYDMAGNVKEWCWNESEDHRRCLRGGAWDDPGYLFTQLDARSPLDRSPEFGFRCVKYLEPPTEKTLSATRKQGRDFAAETPASTEQIEQYLRHYAYFRDAPLNARSSVKPAETYIHETVRIDAAYGEEFDVHLFLPRGARPPYEVVVVVPDMGAFEEEQFVVSSIYTGKCVLGLLEEGRAACWPIYKATYERRHPARDWSLSGERDMIIHIAKDLSRTVDYLQTRGDMDLDKLAYFGVSMGALFAPPLLVVEPRFKAAVLVAGGHGDERQLPEVDSFQFAPYVKIPILMINGRYDQICPLETSQMPLFRDLGSRDKRIQHFDSGHAPPLDETVKLANEWLRETLRTTAQKPIQSRASQPKQTNQPKEDVNRGS